MKNSSILIVIGKQASLDDLAKQLETIRALPARAVVLIIGEMPQYPYGTLGVPTGGIADFSVEWQESVAANTEALKVKTDEVEALLQQHGLSGEVASVACEAAMVSEAVARHAMLCDLALVGPDLRQSETLFQEVSNGILFQSPVGMLINDTNGTALKQPEKIFVAWNTGLHAARAVHAALPMLRGAKEVVIGSIDPVMTQLRDGEDPGVDVAKWLTHHGCTVVVRQYPGGGQDVGDCILDRAAECGADLIVMGSYGHSRTRQAFFGGTTRTLLEQTEKTVFLAH
ncbi:Universal stress protein family protein [Phaeobacter sp. CECT 5382]|uniref:universal stress protein n=1 Tax=Phaeobacter sp. CECT 5382 TaxID=1712645 RepID=UPI0006D9AADC|nr:universal stress protein [Phaeobacter sp. CECT 5382]CUH89236.1 Universal stress protein family protein [Phaeobacter sp. CECT 5382]